MICVKCGLAYKDFTSKKGICSSCRFKSFGDMPGIVTTQDDVKERKDFKYSFIRKNETIPENVARHLKVCEELNKLYEKKNNDYGDSFSGTFKEFGFTMSAIRLQDKLERFKRLSKGNEANVKDESIRDTLVDLANYAIMTVMEIDKNGKE